MLIQNIKTNVVHKTGDPVTRKFNGCTTGYRCCVYGCTNPHLAVEFTEHNNIYIHHTHTRALKSSPGHTASLLPTMYRAYNARHNFVLVRAKCSVCMEATKVEPLFKNPTFYIMPQCAVLIEGEFLVVIAVKGKNPTDLSAEIAACFPSMKQVFFYTINEVADKTIHIYHTQPGKILCKDHQIHIEYPIRLYTKVCPRCQSHHHIISVRDSSALRNIPKKWLKDTHGQPMKCNIWSIPLNGKPPISNRGHYLPHKYTQYDREHWFLYSAQTLRADCRNHIEKNILNAPLRLLMRLEKNKLKGGNLFMIEEPLKGLCDKCIMNELKRTPCCKLCHIKFTKNNTGKDGVCDKCMEKYFKPTELNDIIVPELEFPEMNLLITDIDTVCTAALQQNYRLMEDDDYTDLCRCFDCGRIDLKRNLFESSNIIMKRIFEESDDSDLYLNIMGASSTVYLCTRCTKKCTDCNTIMHARDEMKRCYQCRRGRYLKQRYSVAHGDAILNQRTAIDYF